MKLPLPRNHTVYQFYVLLAALGCLIVAAFKYLDFAMMRFYHPTESGWKWFLAASAVWAAIGVILFVELFTLRYYKKHRPPDP